MIKNIFKIQCSFKFIVDIIIQSCGINWGKQQTHSNLQNSKQIKENKPRFSKHIQNSLLHGTSSSKVVGLIKGNNILTTNCTIQTKYRKKKKKGLSIEHDQEALSSPFLRLMLPPIRSALPPTSNSHTTWLANSLPLNTKKPCRFPTLTNNLFTKRTHYTKSSLLRITHLAQPKHELNTHNLQGS